MKRSGSENNLVGKEQNLSQEFWPTIKIKFSVARVCLRLPHTEASVSQGQDSIFIPLQFVDNILPQLSIFGLIWRGL